MNTPGASDFADLFPLPSQTSAVDREVLVTIRDSLGSRGNYNYLEIGSYLGGSLVPFLKDPRCTRILSIDKRGRDQPDERGRTFDYTQISNQDMLDRLSAENLPLDKLETFDGSISDYMSPAAEFDIIFIDGEHTDVACFRDFLHGLKFLKADSVILFHDTSLIFKAIQIIQEYLSAKGSKFEYLLFANSNMSCVLQGDMCALPLKEQLEVTVDQAAFYAKQDDFLFHQNVQNRLSASDLGSMAIRRVADQLRDKLGR